MGLKDYTIPRAKVDLDETNSIFVRGISLDDISFLIQVHGNDLDNVVSMFRAKLGKSATPDAVAKAVQDNGSDLLLSFIRQFPALASNVIALASGEPDEWQKAAELPMPVQIDALLKIAKVTFNDIDGFKKFLGNVTEALRSVAKQGPNAIQATKSTGTTG